jgi:hypothetical protein
LHAWSVFREVVIFGLGVLVVLDALGLTGGGRSLGELALGLVMIGLLPLDRLLGAFDSLWPRRRARCPEEPC